MMHKIIYFVSVVVFISVPVLEARANLVNPETNLDHSRYLEVMIGEFGVFQPSLEVDGVLTEGLASCIALVLYHPPTRTGLVAHFWPFKDVDASFEKIEESLRRLNINTLELRAHIRNGPYSTMIPVAEKILSYTKQLGVTDINFSIFGSPSDQGSNSPHILIDLRSGNVIGYTRSTPTLKDDAGWRIDRYLNNREGPLDPAPGSL